METNNFQTAIAALEREADSAVDQVPNDVWERLSMLSAAMSSLRALSGAETTGYQVRPGIVLMDTSRMAPSQLGDPVARLKADAFFRHSPADAAKKYLRMFGHAKKLDEIFEALMTHGFDIDGKDDKEKRRNLYVSLVRNTAEFVLVSRLTFGLVEFYPGVRAERATKRKGRAAPEETALPEEDDVPDAESS